MTAAEVLIVVEADIATTQIIEQIVAACASHGVGYKKRQLKELCADDFQPQILPLFIRCCDPETVLWTRALKNAGRSYIYYIDDNFWKITGGTAVAEYYRHPRVRKALEFTVKNARFVVTSSAELARFLSRLNERVVVLPASFDFTLVDGVTCEPTNEVRIGFAGSTSRAADLDVIAPIIESTLHTFRDVVFEFAGAMPNGISAGPRVRFFPYDGDYGRYIKFQRQRNWAIGLAPLFDHDANRCKTDNKYREYSGCGFAGIYSNIPPYADVIEDGVTGLLVGNDPAAWMAAIERLIERPLERSTIAANAGRDVRQRYQLSHVAPQWAEFLLGVAKEQGGQRKRVQPAALALRRRFARLNSMLMRIDVVYESGGLSLLFNRLARKILRAPPWSLLRL
ncbi:MAG: glycosyltransferase [Hyphomicrobium sp.]|jgi:glycosyltransferase involved in cell wall biosynthesis